MANYQESNVAGTKYLRAYQVHVNNGMTNKGITFHEEEVINLDGGEVIQRKAGTVSEGFTANNAATEFNLVNPVDGSPTGATMTYQEVYNALYSLYLHLGNVRDTTPVED